MDAPIDLDPAERAQLADALHLLTTTLGDAVRGILVHGSAVRGGLRPDSDLDLLVVTTRRGTATERRTIIDGLLGISRSPGRPDLPRHLEVTVVVDEDIRPWRYPPRLELQYGDWWRNEFEAGQDTPWHSPDPDLAIVLTAARAEGRSIIGPAADGLLDPVPVADLRTASLAVVPAVLGDLGEDTRNVLLTLARIALTLETGRIEPKDEAADHAAAWLPALAAGTLRRARDGYLGRAEDRWSDPATQAEARIAAEALLGRIEALGRAG